MRPDPCAGLTNVGPIGDNEIPQAQAKYGVLESVLERPRQHSQAVLFRLPCRCRDLVCGVAGPVPHSSESLPEHLGARLMATMSARAIATPMILPRELPRKTRSDVSAAEITTSRKPLREAVSTTIHVIEMTAAASKLASRTERRTTKSAAM